ncbi:MAG: DNA recombination protein RmuC [Janthinobacterium lividum]
MEIIVVALVAVLAGLAAGWLGRGVALGAARTEAAHWRAENDRHLAAVTAAAIAERGYEVERANLRDEVAALAGADARRAVAAEELAGLRAQIGERDTQHTRQLADLNEKFAGIAATALDGAQARFAVAAEEALVRHREAAGVGLEANRTALAELIAPMRDTLGKYEAQLTAIEKTRAEGYGQLTQLLDQVAKGQDRVAGATQKLENVLRTSGKAAGRWGEEQCRNVLELAGLVDGVDFTAQTSTENESGRQQRPDFTVTLPGGRKLVIDVKCSLDAYISAAEADDAEARARYLKAHAAAVRTHATGLAGKSYEKSVAGAVDFVVLFVPGENFLGAAIEQDRALMNDFMTRRVVLAGPINLIAVARTVAAMRDQARLAEQAAEIAKLGRDLYDSLRIMGTNIGRVQKALGGAVEGWNTLVGQLDSRVMLRARKFEALGATTGLETIGEARAIEAVPLLPTAPELVAVPHAVAAE